jgi:transcriptional regulator NrdR family protein
MPPAKHNVARCAKCGGRTYVLSSSTTIRYDLELTLRRRECHRCEDRITTIEVPAEVLDKLLNDHVKRTVFSPENK